jgi:CheY-like chemotaxis protein
VTARIAVIDDEAPNRAYLQTLLSTAGFEVQVAAGGNDGVALVEQERPDLALVDLMMPEVDGFMVCERIRRAPVRRSSCCPHSTRSTGRSGRSSWVPTTTWSSRSSPASWCPASR